MPQNLHKSRSNKVIAGVCGGVGEYFNVDATIIRLVWALAVFMGGSGFIIYILAMIIMPDDPRVEPKKQTVSAIEGSTIQEGAEENGQQSEAANTEAPPVTIQNPGEGKRNQVFGLILVAIGAYFLLERYFPFFELDNWWPVVIILVGLFVMLRGRGGAR